MERERERERSKMLSLETFEFKKKIKWKGRDMCHKKLGFALFSFSKILIC